MDLGIAGRWALVCAASKGLGRGCAEALVREGVHVVITAADIPDHITVDLTGKKIGDVIHINDVELPAGVKPTIARNFVIAAEAIGIGRMAIERATGQRLSQRVAQDLWAPMGAGMDASWSVDSAVLGQARAFCCLNARALDFARIGQHIDAGHLRALSITARTTSSILRAVSSETFLVCDTVRPRNTSPSSSA